MLPDFEEVQADWQIFHSCYSTSSVASFRPLHIACVCVCACVCGAGFVGMEGVWFACIGWLGNEIYEHHTEHTLLYLH